MDAHKALNGDLSNAFEPRRSDIFLTYDNDDGYYVCVSNTTGYTIKEYNRQYICTVEEFNNYKGDDMKTVMDAVNEFKGAWPYNNKPTMCTTSESNNNFDYPIFKASSGISVNEYHIHVCTREEFNTRVQECMTNFGSSVTYDEYKDSCKARLESPLDDDSHQAKVNNIGNVLHNMSCSMDDENEQN